MPTPITVGGIARPDNATARDIERSVILASGGLALVFNIDHTNAMAYANAARSLLSSPAEQALLRRPK